jgi:hypothetical protein
MQGFFLNCWATVSFSRSIILHEVPCLVNHPVNLTVLALLRLVVVVVVVVAILTTG